MAKTYFDYRGLIGATNGMVEDTTAPSETDAATMPSAAGSTAAPILPDSTNYNFITGIVKEVISNPEDYLLHHLQQLA